MRDDSHGKDGSAGATLEEKLIEWRRDVSASGFPSRQVLDELESHLREEIEVQIGAGVDDCAAFKNAVERLGEARVLKAEFKKTMSLFSGFGRKVRGILGARIRLPVFQFASRISRSSRPRRESLRRNGHMSNLLPRRREGRSHCLHELLPALRFQLEALAPSSREAVVLRTTVIL